MSQEQDTAPSRCEGWASRDCPRPWTFWMSWSYQGARSFPSGHHFCGSCTAECWSWVQRLAEAHRFDPHITVVARWVLD